MRKRLLALVLIASLVLTAVALQPGAVSAQGGNPFPRTACKEDLTGKEIMFHTFGDLSGPFAPITQPLAKGFADAIAFYNKNGGICGATIKIMSDDTTGNQEVTQSLYQRYRTLNPKPLLLLLYASADAELLRARVAEDEIPVFLFAGSTAGLYGEKANEPGWIFAGIPLYTDQFGAFCKWAGENWSKMGKSGTPTVGHLSWEGAFGRSTETAETTAYCKSVGVEVVGGEYFLPTATDVTAQIQSLVGKGANIIYTTSLASGSALIAAGITNLGLEDQVMLAGANWVLDTSVGLLGQRVLKPSGLPSTDGLVGLLPYVWWDEPTPGTKFVQEQFAGAQPPNSPLARGIAYLAGFGTIDTYVEIITQTINRVGSANLTGKAVYETLNNFSYDALGGVFKFSWTPERRAQNQVRIGQMGYLMGPDGKPVIVEVGGNKALVPTIKPLTEAFVTTPDLRPGGKDVVK